ncbi:DegT/DnrJ/EryC1/StrS family aminotransferase [Rhodoligotrophos defluvii]|uniref:DegT/DnrJ/EryC1/StrS family aminotransferase n=1 Tax=Rhodoligotrophos defluvii TaxID=2561934 RepID=UPI0010C993EB|nr:DegT/DnrJ/EryC1/StrS aminotransferase family protein [Rhodoligotrophos defluvii]
MLRNAPPVPPTRIDFSDEDAAWIAERITEVLKTGRLTLGPYTEAFEAAFAKYCGARHAIAVSSGTSSLEIILRGLDIAGKSVLVPADTFFATAAAVIAAGGKPILMDSDISTMSTAPEEIERRITPDTVGIVIVHIAGIVTDRMPEIVRLADARGLWIMEDAAHAHGSTLAGRHAGTFGRAGSFSFYPTKVMTSAEGGMIVTDDDELAAAARIFRDQGKASFHQNLHVKMGNNWRLSEPHAIIGLRHFSHLDGMITDRRRIAEFYDQELGNGRSAFTPIAPPADCFANYYKYPVMLPEGVDRAAVKAWLKEEHGVICAGEVYEAPLHKHPVFHKLDTGDLGQSEHLCSRHICLPIFASMTDGEAERVIAAVKAAERGKAAASLASA